MKLLYQGNGLDPMHVRRQKRRAWFKDICDICLEAVGVVFMLGACWAFIILMFLM